MMIFNTKERAQKMKKLILPVFAVLTAVLVLAGCEKAPSSADVKSESSSTLTSVEENSGAQTELSESSGVSEKAPPEGYFEAQWGGFSVYLPEESVLATYGEKITAKENSLFCDSSENAVEFAKIISVDPVSDPEKPFAPYDERYAGELSSLITPDAESITDTTLAGKECRVYSLQKEVKTDLGTEYENKKVYCILSGDEIIVIEFIPLRGIGGISTQREEFEKILDTLVIE